MCIVSRARRGRAARFVLVIAGSTAASTASAGSVLYVDDDAPPGGDGASWPTAYRFLQEAIAAAARPPGDVGEIRVAQGAYRPDRDERNPDGTGDRGASFALIEGVVLAGGYAGLGAPDPDARDVDLYPAVLSGDLLGDDGPPFTNDGDNSFHVVVAVDVDRTAVLDGFTITAGNGAGNPMGPRGGGILVAGGAPTVSVCLVTLNRAEDGLGGGIAVTAGAPIVGGCRITGNVASFGGGVFLSSDSHATLEACELSANAASVTGGGLHDRSSGLVLRSCLVADNTAELQGGGSYHSFGAAPLLDDCVFTANSTSGVGGGTLVFGDATVDACVFEKNWAASGGGVGGRSGHLTLSNCSVIENVASHNGAGLYEEGCSVLLRDCLFVRNRVVSDGPCRGGGIYCAGGDTELVRCRLLGNVAQVERAGSSADGGGLFIIGGSVRIAGSILSGNSARVAPPGPALASGGSASGGAIHNLLGRLRLANSALSGNAALSDDQPLSAGCLLNADLAFVVNTILWSNGPDQIEGIRESTIVLHSCVEQGHEGFGNIDSAPLFVRAPDPGPDGTWGTTDDDYGDLHLLPESPCIDAGVNNGAGPDVADIDGNGDIFELTPLDLDGAPRFADALGARDSGCGFGPLVDMGAYELTGGPTGQPAWGDVDGDGDGDGGVGGQDLELLLGAWGPAKSCEPADLDADGVVGTSDLLILLLGWSV